MEKVVPPFKVDVAGTFLLPPALREAREQYRNEQISCLLCVLSKMPKYGIWWTD